jgi:hypothetical protein
MVTTAELADAQGGMRTLVDKDLEEFFASLDLSKPEFARDAMLEHVPVIIGSWPRPRTWMLLPRVCGV